MLCYASGYAYGTGTTSVVVNIPYIRDYVPVIDNIIATTINGTINSAATVDVGGVVIERFQMPLAQAYRFNTQVSHGFPLWRTSGNDGWGWPESVISNEPGGGLTTQPMYGNAAAPNAFVGQSFTTGAAHTITSIWVYMRKVGSPTDDTNMTLHSGSISGPDIALSAAVPLPDISQSPQWVEYVFETPVALAAATKYYCHMERSAVSTTDYPEVYLSTNSNMAGGGFYIYGTGAWSGESGTNDMMFRTSGHLPITLTLPTSSTGSYLGVVYHYAKPSQLRD